MESILKYLVLIRHGEYENNQAIGGSLSAEGKKNVQRLAYELGSIFINRKVAIISSSAGRALQTAEIISKTIGSSYDQYQDLWSEEDKPPNYEKLWEIISSDKKNEVIIVVTHFEYLKGFPSFFASKFPKIFQTRYWQPISIGYSEALQLDLENGVRKKTTPFQHCFSVDRL